MGPLHCYYLMRHYLVTFLNNVLLFLFFKILFICIERGREGEREGKKKHQCVVASHMPQTGDLAHNPGMCPEWELSQRPFWFASQHSVHWATEARAHS